MTQQESSSFALQFLPLAHKIAHQVQLREEDHEDLVHEGFLALYSSVLDLASVEEIRRPLGFAGAVLRRAMQNYYYSEYTAPEVQVESIEFIPVRIYGEEEYLQRVYISAFFEELERVHGPIARDVAECLWQPYPCVVALALAEQKEKAVRLEAGEAVRGVKTLRITQTHIREALGISNNALAAFIRDIREFASIWFSQPALVG